jgi:CheY-like chemotaxis protein
MDPLALLTAAVAYVGAEVAKKCGSLVVDQAFQGLKAFLKAKLGREPLPEDLTPERLRSVRVEDSPEFVQRAREIVSHSTALRRAELVRSVLQGARLLWVDDLPRNNAYECRTLAALGITVEQVVSTHEALEKTRRATYDVILSDMARDRPDAGLELLRQLRAAGCRTEVIFYVGRVDKDRGMPVGAFGLTNQPEPLLHYIFDVLERQRV